MNNIHPKLMRNFLLGFVAMTVSVKSIASMPIPDALALDEYVKRYSPMIFIGEFRGMVNISGELSSKLMNPRVDVDYAELKFTSEPSPGGESFMELRNMKIIYAPKNSRVDLCEYPVAYQAKNIVLQGGTDFDIYHRSLIGKRIILFLNGPGKYGRGSTDFPKPLFFSAGGVNWRDGAPLLESQLTEIHKTVKNSNLVEIRANSCHKRDGKQ